MMRFLSAALVTSTFPLNACLTRFDFFRRKWLLPTLVRKILPFLVTRNRFAAALYVFNLYFFFALAICTPHEKVQQ